MKVIKRLQYFSKKDPNFLAIDGKFLNLNYFDLLRLVNKLSNFLNSNYSSGPILIYAERKSLSYPLMLACLKLKITYIPISSGVPRSRIKKIINLTKCKLIINLSSKKLYFPQKKIINILNYDYLDIEKKKIKIKKKSNNQIAYIIFTSGSTGMPKGVKISYKSLNHYSIWLENNFKIRRQRCSQFSEIGFDLSIMDIFGTIISGGTICSVEEDYYKTFPGRFLNDKKIHNAVFVPSIIDLIYTAKDLNKKNLSKLKSIFFCGEPLKKNHLNNLFKYNKNLKIINTYGPTEFTVSCSQVNLTIKNYKKFIDRYITIGKPNKGIKFLLIKENKWDDHGRLFLNGKQLFSGYVNDDENLNKIKLIENKIYYDTGDIVKKRNNYYYFVKREDNQIKKMGHRIELDEIESLLQSKVNCEFVKCYFIKNRIILIINTRKTENFIFKILKTNLPDYMVPSKILYLNNIPLNKNYKINYSKIKKILLNDKKKNYQFN